MANRKPLVVVGGEFVELPDGDVSTPSGPAGGVLSGQFPNPGFAEPMATQAELDAVAASAASDATAKANAAQAASTPVAHGTNTNNPHNTTKAQVGLGNVDNTSDASKPVSTAQAAADLAAVNTAKLYTDSLIADGITFPDGTIAAPGIAFNADNSTGFRRLPIGAVSLVLGGIDRAVFYQGSNDFMGYVKSITPNGGGIQGLRDAALSWFIGDLKEATGSGAGMVNWVYGDNPYAVYINGVERFKVDSAGASGSRFLNGAPMGASQGNARNHFKQYNSGIAPLTAGWVAAAFGDETGNRVVIGQGEGEAIVGGHSGGLNAWSSLVLAGEQFSWSSNGQSNGRMMTLDSSANLAINGNFKLNNQQYLSSGSFGRFWGNPSLAIGQAQFAGLYGAAITYNAKIVGSAWQSIGGGTATAMTMDEGIFSISQSQSVAADGVPLDWTTSMQVTPALAEFKGQLHADGGGVGWAPSGRQGAVLGRVGDDAYVSTFYDVSSLTIGAGSTQKNNITVFGHTHPSGSQITAVVGGANRLQIQGIRSRFFNLLVASGGAGNTYSEAGITVDGGGTNAIKPSLGFHQPGFFAGTLRQDDATQFGFYQIDGTSPADLYIRNLRTTGQLLAGVASSTAKAHIDSSTYGAGLTVASIANTASQVNIGIGYLTAGCPFVGTNPGSNPLDIGTRSAVPIRFYTDSVQRASLSEVDGTFTAGRLVSGYNYPADSGNNITVIGAGTDTANMPYLVTNHRAVIGNYGTSYNAGGLLMAAYRDVRSTAYLGGVTLQAQNVNNVTSIGLKLVFRIGTSAGDGESFAQSGNSALPNERMSISDTGSLVVDHPAGGGSGSGFVTFSLAGTTIGSITQSGTTAITYNNTSDWRLKTKVRPADARRFMEIRFRDFEWVDGRHDCGVIAHELQEIYPDLVTGEKDAVETRTVEVSPAVTEKRLVSEAVPTVYDGDQIVSMGTEAVYETVTVTPAVTEDREFPVYQQVNYQGLIARMGTVIQQQNRALEALTARIEALEKLSAK